MYKECVPQDLIRVDHSRNKRENLCEIKKQPKSSLNFYWSSSKTKTKKKNEQKIQKKICIFTICKIGEEIVWSMQIWSHRAEWWHIQKRKNERCTYWRVLCLLRSNSYFIVFNSFWSTLLNVLILNLLHEYRRICNYLCMLSDLHSTRLTCFTLDVLVDLLQS